MTMDPKLMNAILAMDSYNRGYNVGIDLAALGIGNQLGLATILKESDIDTNTAGVNAGFYAIAYQYPDFGIGDSSA